MTIRKSLVNFPFIKQAINGDYDFTSSGKNQDYVKKPNQSNRAFYSGSKDYKTANTAQKWHNKTLNKNIDK